MRLESLHKVVGMAKEAEAAESKRLAAMRQMLEREEQQAQQLQQHRQFYLGLAPASGQSLTAQHLAQYTHFLQKLGEAMTQQSARIDHFREQCARQQERWLAQHVRVKSLQTLVDKEEARRAHKAEQIEQHQLDEVNQRRRDRS